MRLSRWGWSPYETQEDARLERRCLAPLVTIVPDSADAEIVVVHSKINVGEEEIRRAPSLRLVITTTSGTDHIDLVACARSNIQVCRLPEARRDAVVEATIAMLIWGMRRIGTLQQFADGGDWARADLPDIAPVGISGAKIGVVGLGVIGMRVATVLQGLGATIWSADPRGVPDDHYAASVQEMVGHCDAVTLHCDLNSSSLGLVSEAVLQNAHPDLVIVNTARGPLLDVLAAFNAIHASRLAALCLDVFDTEPFPDMGISATHPGILLTPHSAGYHRDLATSIRRDLERAVRAFTLGDALPHRVN